MKKYVKSDYSYADTDYQTFEGFDHYGSKTMYPFEGKAIIMYDGGPGGIEIIRKARNGRYVWKNTADVGDPYIFKSFKDALPVQQKVGGEIVPVEEYSDGTYTY